MPAEADLAFDRPINLFRTGVNDPNDPDKELDSTPAIVY